MDRAVGAWNYTSRNLTRIRLPKRFEARIFDAHCVLASGTALAGGPNRWSGWPHHGQVDLPGGEAIPASVISFASSDGSTGFFVMSTPSVWRAAKVDSGPLDLESLMVAILLHEGSHVAQVPTYGRRMDELSKRHDLPDSFNDDSIQKRFQSNPEFARSVAEERRLLLEASRASARSDALKLAGMARRLMRQRHARWFTGSDAYLMQAEDIWLTMEGSAQWAGYRWLIDPRGGRQKPEAADVSFGSRGKWWSQTEGFALFMALDRLTDGLWKPHAFGDGAKTGLQMLDAALGENP